LVQRLKRAGWPLFWYKIKNSTEPLSHFYGLDRGQALDRFYIENFLQENRGFIAGRCLEILNNEYSLKFGGKQVTQADILDIETKNPKANIIADLRRMPEILSETYDCLILTQTLQFIDNIPNALAECSRILKPGGYILATLPALSRIDCVAGKDGDFWRFTEAAANYLFKKDFQTVFTKSYGNCRSAMLFLAGAAQEEVSQKVLEKTDPDFPVIIGVLAQK
jgi:SAM-dependent methyltransferase